VKRPVETPYELKRSVGLRVAELRERSGSTVGELAHALDVGDRYVQRVEAGQENLTLESLAKLGRVLDIPVVEFFMAPTKRERPPGRPAGRAEQAPRRRVARTKR